MSHPRLPVPRSLDAPVAPQTAGVAMIALTALLWVIEIVDTLLGGALDYWGISPRDPAELPEIYTAPLLHHGFGHLISNSVPLIVLGTLILLAGLKPWLVATVTTVTVSGLVVWLFAPDHSVTIGASGVVFGWLAYLLTRGLFTKNVGQIVLAVVVFALYGGVLWGVLPQSSGVSWQAHLGGALGGVLAAWLLHSTSERRRTLGRRPSAG